MLFLRGEKEVLQTINILSESLQISGPDNSYDSLVQKYKILLNKVQPWVPHSNQLYPTYLTDPKIIQRLLETFGTKSAADDTYYDLDTASMKESEIILSKTRELVKALGDEYPPFLWIFNLVIDTVFNVSSKIASGGTTSAAVGVLFIDPRKNYTKEDFYELLVHELGHTLLFISEWRYGLFNDVTRITDSNTYAMSAIRNQLRPFDKAFHSVVVSIEILLLRTNVIGHEQKRYLHPSTNKLVPMVNQAIESIRETDQREDMLTPYGKKLLLDCRNAMTKFSEKRMDNVFTSGI